MAKVFIVNDSGHDFSSAKTRGQLVVLSTGKVNVFATDRLLKELEEGLKDSGPDDYLLPAGNSVASCLAYSVLLVKHQKVNLLIYSFKNFEYEIRTVRAQQYGAAGVAEA